MYVKIQFGNEKLADIMFMATVMVTLELGVGNTA